MKPAQRPKPTAVSLRRWLCAWLALLMALQVAASVLAGLHGALHRHRPVPTQAHDATTPAVRWDHAARADAAHRTQHQTGAWHTHELHDASVVPLVADAMSDALAQLAGVVTPLQRHAAHACAPARHARPCAVAWWAGSRSVAPPLKPPRG